MKAGGSCWTGKRVVVTGGAGFLGTHVAKRLEADVVHRLAGQAGGIGANKASPGGFFYRNAMMGANVLHEAWKAGAEKVVAAAAGCGYPENARLPLKEDDYWSGFPQDESAPYALAKRMLHVHSLAYWRQYRFPSS